MGRAFGFLSVVSVLAVGLYFYARQVQSTSAAAGTSNPQATINMTGVRTDLMAIAAAERRYYAGEGKYGSLDEMIDSHYITITRQRPPYTYDVQISAGGFRVIATRTGENISGTPAQISVDENMEFQTTD